MKTRGVVLIVIGSLMALFFLCLAGVGGLASIAPGQDHATSNGNQVQATVPATPGRTASDDLAARLRAYVALVDQDHDVDRAAHDSIISVTITSFDVDITTNLPKSLSSRDPVNVLCLTALQFSVAQGLDATKIYETIHGVNGALLAERIGADPCRIFV